MIKGAETTPLSPEEAKKIARNSALYDIRQSNAFFDHGVINNFAIEYIVRNLHKFDYSLEEIRQIFDTGHAPADGSTSEPSRWWNNVMETVDEEHQKIVEGNNS